MSEQRMKEINVALQQLATEMQSIAARAYPLVLELEASGMKVPPGLHTMFAGFYDRKQA
jgi:hypothetical protein